MEYKGYTAKPAYSDKDDILFCVIRAGRDTISFHGESIKEFREEFHLAIDDYLAQCKEEGVEPGTMFSGVFQVRTEPDIHAALVSMAEASGNKLNTLANEAFDRYVGEAHA